MHKIQSIESLAKIIKVEKEKGKKIVLCHGVFDLLHIGHIRYLSQAKKLGDLLIVTLTTDQFVDKGPNRPAFTKNLRAEAIASLSCVDYVSINPWPTAVEIIRLFAPDYYVKGSEFKNLSSDITGKIAQEEKVATEVGTKMAFIDDIVFSSTNLINRYLSVFSEEVQHYLNVFRQRYSIEDIIEVIDKMSKLNVLIVGDTILDEYVYCNAIGKSSKDPILALKYQSHDLFLGGSLALANQVSNFAQNVTVKTIIGENNNYENFIHSNLKPNVSLSVEIQSNASTIVKRRYIDGYTFNKLFEIYMMDDSGLDEIQNKTVCSWLSENIENYDIVIASDFGHGAISQDMVNILCSQTPFLSVNTQANAGNRGFHTISRYPKASFACIAEHELRLETRDLKTDLRPLMLKLHDTLDYKKLVVTSGKKGSSICEKNNKFLQVPAFAKNVVDRVGAGDTFFSLASLCACLDAPNELICFLGNVISSLSVEVLGNQTSIDKLSVIAYIKSLLK